MTDSGFVQSDLDIRKFIDTGPYQAALDSLLAANPGDPYWQARARQFKERD